MTDALGVLGITPELSISVNLRPIVVDLRDTMLTLIASAALLAAPAADHHGQHGAHHQAHSEASPTVAAEVRAVDQENRTALVTHEALTELGMGAMTMRFIVVDEVDLSLLQAGASLTITVTEGADGFQIIRAEPR